MRRFFLVLVLWAGIAAPSYADVCMGVFASQAQASAACTAVYGGTCPTSGSGPAYCSPVVTGSSYRIPNSPYNVYVWATGGGCPVGYSAHPTTGKCIAGATAGQKAAAKSAARAEAAAEGLDEAARVAAENKAEETLDAWIAYGKTEAEAAKAAASAGAMAGMQNVYTRYASESASAKATCISSGVDSLACASAYATYENHMAAAGAPVGKVPAYTVETTSGKTVTYQLASDGLFDVFQQSGDGRVTSWLGRSSTLNFAPSVEVEPVFGSVNPGAVNVANGEPVRDPMRPPASVLDAAANPLPVLSPETSTLGYFSTSTGLEVGRVTRLSDGSVVTTGSPPSGAENQLGRALVNAGVSSGGGSSGGGASGTVNVSDPGASAYAGSTSGVDSAKNSFQALYDGVSSKTIAHGWSWGFSSLNLVTPACTPWRIATGGRSIDMDICPVAEKIRDIGAFVLYVLTAIGLFNIMTGTREHS